MTADGDFGSDASLPQLIRACFEKLARAMAEYAAAQGARNGLTSIGSKT